MATNVQHDSETPADGQQVFTACAFIHRNSDGQHQLFMPRRAKTKKFLPDVFELPGGHIDFGEQMIDGLKREITEEFRVTVRIGDPFAVFTYTNPIKKSHSIEVAYFAQFLEESPNLILHPDDHSEYIWLNESEIDTVLVPNKGADSPEIQVIRKGFSLLRGNHLDFGVADRSAI